MGKYSINKLPSDILKSTASKVSAVRKSMHLTQIELAEKAGVSYGSIKRFERTGKISFESLLKIAEALDRLPEFEKLFVLTTNNRVEKLFNSSE